MINKYTLLIVSYFVFLTTLSYSSPTAISNIQAVSTTIGQYNKFEITFSANTSYSNPYDPDIVDIEVHFISPSSVEKVIPGFWFQNYSPVTGSFENYNPIGSPTWMARFAPLELGTYTYYIQVTDANGISSTGQFTFSCVSSGSPGFLHLHPTNNQFLQFTNGKTYFPIGHDVAWDDGSGTLFFNHYYTKMNQNQENWSRFWMASFDRLGLEWCTCDWSGDYLGLGKYGQIPAWRIDYALDLAQQEGIYLQLVLLHHGEFSSNTDPQWNQNPYNTVNGGFLSTPDLYFTNSTAQIYAKKLFRYIVSRWGYNTNIMAWEIFNEVEWTDNFISNTTQQINVANWHEEMAHYIKQIDPYPHLVTTSSDYPGFQYIWPQPDIDIVEDHYYGSGREQAIHTQTTSLGIYGKPVYVAEFGSANYETTELLDSTGVYLHNGIWAAAMSQTVAGSWWWDNVIDPFNLYYHFSALANYMAGEDFAADNLSYANFSITTGSSDTTGLQVYPGLGWDSSEQSVFYIQPDGSIPGIQLLASYIQGVWHENMGQQAIFYFNQSTTGYFGLYVSSTSQYGAPELQIFLDDTTVPVYDSSAVPLGLITIPVSAGSHMVKVFNNGLDWFNVDYYTFIGVSVVAAEGYGLANSNRAYFWIHDRASQPLQAGNGIISGTQLQINNLSDGPYNVQYFNTYTGATISQPINQSVIGGTLTLTIPNFQDDIALKLTPGFVDVDLWYLY